MLVGEKIRLLAFIAWLPFVVVVSWLFADVLSAVAQQYFQEREYFKRSSSLLHRFDEVRRFRQSSHVPKPSSSSYSGDLEMSSRLQDKNYERENATILMLCRNWELDGVLKSMRSLEDRFNRDYQYDWTFLNDVPFDNDFIEATTAMASGKTQYAMIPPSDWNKPNWIDNREFNEQLNLLRDKGVLYGGSKSYRNMCRFNSGFFFRQRILDQYKYYFRVEPDVEYFCDFPFDPFRILREQNKKYSFVISMYEYEDTIPTLWEATEEFMDLHEHLIHPNNSLGFLTDSSVIGRFPPVTESNSDYNLCHFWSNFEIADLDFFRSEAYLEYFNFLDSKGGFYYERWGDAPVHSIAAALLLDRREIHHFDEIGYYHTPYSTIPSSYSARLLNRCIYDKDADSLIDIRINSCLMRWWKNGSGKFFLRK